MIRLAYKTREDAWTREDDGLLINTILDFITDGRTQLQAFEEVADMLDRTPAAVGFRFNGTLRDKYRDEIAKAKRIREENRKKKKQASKVAVVEVVKEEPKAPVREVKELIPETDFPTSDLSIYDSISDILKKFGAMEKKLKEVEEENKMLKRKLGQ